MKKLIIVLSSVFLFASCFTDDKNSDINLTEVSSISMEIDSIYSKYKYDESKGEKKYTLRKIDPKKAVVLGAADALGGFFARGGGAYAMLWGGFGTSYMIEDIIYGGYSVPLDGDIYGNSRDFIQGELGRSHNKLLFEANTNYKNINLLDYSNKEILKEFLYQNTECNNFEEIFANGEAEFYALLENGKEAIVSNELSFDVLNSLSENKATENESEVIKNINERIRFIDKDNVSLFLKDVENYVLSSVLFEEDEKNNLFVYIGILNSSYQFWSIVDFE